MSSGKERWGLAKKINGIYAHLLGLTSDYEDSDMDESFCIIISKDVWDSINPRKRIALVDHELCHCGIDYDKEGEIKLVILPHDVEDFGRIVERHGLWSDDMERFARFVDNRPQTFIEFDDLPPPVQKASGNARHSHPAAIKTGRNGLTSMTIESGGQSVTLTPDKIQRAVNRLRSAAPPA